MKTLRVRGAYISGPVERLDLRGVTFSKCLFRDVSFSRCNVDSSTVFEDCDFRGEFGVADQADKWRGVRIIGAHAEPPASIAISEIVSKSAISPETVAVDALRMAMERFWHHGQLRRSMRFDEWNRGLLGSTQMAGLILESLLKAKVVQRIEISSVKEGGLGIPVESIPDMKQLMDNNQITGRLRVAYDDLVSKLR